MTNREQYRVRMWCRSGYVYHRGCDGDVCVFSEFEKARKLANLLREDHRSEFKVSITILRSDGSEEDTPY